MLRSKRLKRLVQIDDQVQKKATTTSTNTLRTDRVWSHPFRLYTQVAKQYRKICVISGSIYFWVALRFPEASTTIDSPETRIKRHSVFTGSSREDRGFILGRDYNFFFADASDRFKGPSASWPMVLMILFRSSNSCNMELIIRLPGLSSTRMRETVSPFPNMSS
jgi:hypothetical protein